MSLAPPALLACLAWLLAGADPPRPDAAHSPTLPLCLLNIHHPLSWKVSAHFPNTQRSDDRPKPRKSWNGGVAAVELVLFYCSFTINSRGREWRLGFTTMTLVSFEVAASCSSSVECKSQRSGKHE